MKLKEYVTMLQGVLMMYPDMELARLEYEGDIQVSINPVTKIKVSESLVIVHDFSKIPYFACTFPQPNETPTHMLIR